jgi:hypothetical protein
MTTLYMAWRGVDDDQNLYWGVSFDGKWWSPQIQLSDRASADAPALAAFQGKLFMVWRGAGEYNLWWSTYDGNADFKWSDQQQLTDRGSVEGPSLAVFKDNLFMAWRGIPGDQNLYWAMHDENDPRKWTDQHQISQSASFDVPALGVFQDALFMAWRGVEGDENLYWTTYNENTGMWNNQSPPLTDRGSTEGPALVEFQGKFYMVWKGVRGIDEDDRRLFWAAFDPNDPRQWTNENIMQGPTSGQSGSVIIGSVHRPTLTVFQDSIYVAGSGPSIAGEPGLPDTGEGVDSPGHPKAPPPPKGLFYTTFDGSVPGVPILFTNRASEQTVAQAVYADIPFSLRSLLTKHNFDPSKGLRAFEAAFSPGISRTTPIPLRSFVGF